MDILKEKGYDFHIFLDKAAVILFSIFYFEALNGVNYKPDITKQIKIKINIIKILISIKAWIP